MEHNPHSAPLEDARPGPLIDIGRVEGRLKASVVKKVGEIIDTHPREALAIVRTWLYQEA
jgi:flagellar M-ring protein FliF